MHIKWEKSSTETKETFATKVDLCATTHLGEEIMHFTKAFID